MKEMDNPLLQLFSALPHETFSDRRIEKNLSMQEAREVFQRFGVPWDERLSCLLPDFVHTHTFEFMARDFAVWQWAWAVPTPATIRTLVKYSPLVEIGAGTGYWARLAREAGADILAFDVEPRGGGVAAGGPEQAALYPERALFLCWPPYGNPMAADCLRAYQGKSVIYVGEHGGATADDGFHTMLEAWEEIEVCSIPQWSGMHDAMYVYRRAPQ